MTQLPGHVSRRFIMNGTAGPRFFLLYSTLFLISPVLYYGRTDLLLSLVAARKVTVDWIPAQAVLGCPGT